MLFDIILVTETGREVLGPFSDLADVIKSVDIYRRHPHIDSADWQIHVDHNIPREEATK